VTIEEQLGEGSYGVVYRGTLVDGGQSRQVVLKKHKRGVDNAVELQEAELYFNARVLADTTDACAAFLGVIRVDRSQSAGRLVSGLWLVWAFEGRFTLSNYLRAQNYAVSLGAALFPTDAGGALLDDVEDPELVLAQTVMKQLLQALQQLHTVGLVHRDVKPLNLVLDERQRRFKLIDLGACADLRTGKNFAPDETILDPKYSPPEEFLMPIEQAPDLAKESATIARALGASAWARYQPDRFDVYSAGIVFMQLSVPQLRTDRGLKAFNDQLAGVQHDLLAWRASANLPIVQTAVLDAFNGAGWELAESLLRPRPTNWADPLAFNTRPRPSAEQALGHRFFAGVPPRVRTSVDGQTRQALARAREIARLESALAFQTKALSDAKSKVENLTVSGAGQADANERSDSAALEQKQRGLEGLLGALRAGLDRVLGGSNSIVAPPAAGRVPLPSSLGSQDDDEGAAEDTPTPLQRRPVKPGAPRDPVAAAAAAQKALDALRTEARLAQESNAQPEPAAGSAASGATPPPRDIASLTNEISDVSQRLLSMQSRMTKLLQENDQLLREMETSESGGRTAAVEAAAKVAAASAAISNALEQAAAADTAGGAGEQRSPGDDE